MNLIKQTIDEYAKLRRGRGWTTRIAAKKIGVSQPHLVNILNYRRIPSTEILKRMFFILVSYQIKELTGNNCKVSSKNSVLSSYQDIDRISIYDYSYTHSL